MTETTSWHSYPSIFALGHRALGELLLDPVLIEEKVDGSQFSFGVFLENGNRVLKCRSKGAEIHVDAPEKLFNKAVEVVKELEPKLVPGWTYRAEYLAKPKHNTLAYNRVPSKYLMLFDINTGHEEYLNYLHKRDEAARLGLETVPALYIYKTLASADELRQLLECESVLGGQKIEGVVVKNYHRFGPDKKALMGKYVSEAFKEIHKSAWRKANPTKADIVEALIAELRTPARWNKGIQHLREAGVLENDPRDIGKLMKEIPTDIEKEEAEYIKQRLFDSFWPQIRRGATAGLPEYYKQQLLERQFTVS